MIEDFQEPSFRRDPRRIQETGVLIALVAFLAAYFYVGPVQKVVDIAVDPAVMGINMILTRLSDVTEKYTGRRPYGPPVMAVDDEFDYRVLTANHVNDRQALPLLKLACDPKLDNGMREYALASLLFFDSTSQWVQPFLNELSKGAIPGLYDDNAQVLDLLIAKIREEGGVRETLVRAYAESVFSFMLQNPDATLRRRAASWLSDVLAEDALFLILPRLAKETDAKVRLALEQALWDIRAVSEPNLAVKEALPHFRQPGWPEVRQPLAVVLSRLGYKPAIGYITSVNDSFEESDPRAVSVKIARDGVPYPTALAMSEHASAQREARRAAREKQIAEASGAAGSLAAARVREKAVVSTYFILQADDGTCFKAPRDGAEAAGTLEKGVLYKALDSSSRMGADTWFQLELAGGEKGWIKAGQLQLAGRR